MSARTYVRRLSDAEHQAADLAGLLTIREAAAHVGLTLAQVRGRVERRTIPFVRSGRALRFDPAALDDWSRVLSGPEPIDSDDPIVEPDEVWKIDAPRAPVDDRRPPQLRGRAVPRPFPFEPLAVAVRNGRPAHRNGGACPCTQDGTGRRACCTTGDLADELGIGLRQAHRLRESGLTVEQADHFAIVLDLHPALIWSDWWLEVDDEEDLDDVAA